MLFLEPGKLQTLTGVILSLDWIPRIFWNLENLEISYIGLNQMIELVGTFKIVPIFVRRCKGIKSRCQGIRSKLVYHEIQNFPLNHNIYLVYKKSSQEKNRLLVIQPIYPVSQIILCHERSPSYYLRITLMKPPANCKLSHWRLFQIYCDDYNYFVLDIKSVFKTFELQKSKFKVKVDRNPVTE